MAVTGIFYVNFADIRDSENAYSTIKTYRREWNVQYILPKQFALKFHPEKLRFSSVSNYEGQVLVKAKHVGLPQHFDAVAIGHRIKEALEQYGCIIAFDLDMVKASVASYRVEFSNVNTIDTLSRLNDPVFAVGFPLRKPGTCRWLTHTDVYLEHSFLPARPGMPNSTPLKIAWSSYYRTGDELGK